MNQFQQVELNRESDMLEHLVLKKLSYHIYLPFQDDKCNWVSLNFPLSIYKMKCKGFFLFFFHSAVHHLWISKYQTISNISNICQELFASNITYIWNFLIDCWPVPFQQVDSMPWFIYRFLSVHADVSYLCVWLSASVCKLELFAILFRKIPNFWIGD